jgi:hypothetical protein
VSDGQVVPSPRVPRGRRGLLGLRINTYSQRKRSYTTLQSGSDCIVDAFESRTARRRAQRF